MTTGSQKRTVGGGRSLLPEILSQTEPVGTHNTFAAYCGRRSNKNKKVQKDKNFE